MSQKREALRQLLSSDGQFIAAGTLTVMTARIAERAGLPALYVSGQAVAALHRGLPDYGVLDAPEMIQVSGQIANSVEIPTLADAGGLGGNVGSVFRWTREYERAGLAGIVVDDAAAPSHTSESAALLGVEDMQARIRASVNARTDPSFVIAVRSCGDDGVDATVERGLAYATAGADVFVISGSDAIALSSVAQQLSVPCAAIAVPRGAVDGLSMVISTGWELATTVRFYAEGVREYRETGQITRERFQRASGFYSLLEEANYLSVISDWAEGVGANTAEAWRAMQ